MLGFQDESGMMSDFGQREMAKQAAGAKSGCVRRPPRVGRQRDISFFSLSPFSAMGVRIRPGFSFWLVRRPRGNLRELAFGEACFGAPFFCILLPFCFVSNLVLLMRVVLARCGTG